MRLRATTVHASNQNDYLKQLGVSEQDYIDNIALPAFGFISLDSNELEDEYQGLSSMGAYHLEMIDQRKTRRRRSKHGRAPIIPMFRKKISNVKKRNSIATSSQLSSCRS